MYPHHGRIFFDPHGGPTLLLNIWYKQVGVQLTHTSLCSGEKASWGSGHGWLHPVGCSWPCGNWRPGSSNYGKDWSTPPWAWRDEKGRRRGGELEASALSGLLTLLCGFDCHFYFGVVRKGFLNFAAPLTSHECWDCKPVFWRSNILYL